MKRKVIIGLLGLFSVLLSIRGSTGLAAEANYDVDEQPVTFRLIEGKGAAVGGQGTHGGLADTGSFAQTMRGLLPNTNETRVLLISFIGALMVGVVFLILWRRRRDDET